MSSLFQRAAAWAAEPDAEPEGRTGGWKGLARLAASTAFLLAVFLVLNRFVIRACTLPESALARESILGECITNRWFVLLPGLALYALLLAAVPRLREGWHQFEGGSSLRWFVGTLAIVLAWAGAGYAYNAWYDQPHAFDRGALVLLATLVFWRPAFVLPFVVSFWAVIWQFQTPQLGFPILVADFRPLANILTMFGAAMLAQAVWKRRKMSGFLFLTLCIVAANFWVPGYAKLRLGWITFGHVYFLLPNAYTHGWLAFLEPRTIASMTRALAWTDWPMRIGTLCVECGALVIFASSRIARAFLLLFTMMLGIVFLTIGYLFLKWAILHVALWLLLFRQSHSAGASWRRDLFTGPRLAISIFVIAGAARWFSPAPLAWFDTPLTSTIRYEAVGRSGAVYDLPPRFFAPYDSQVAMALFAGGLTPEPILAGAYGVTSDRSVAEALLAAATPRDVIRLEEVALSRRQIQVDERFGKEFDEFVRRTVTVSNRRLSEGWTPSRLLGFVRPPAFFVTFQRGRPYGDEEPIAQVRVYRVSSFFDGWSYSVFRKEPLRTITTF